MGCAVSVSRVGTRATTDPGWDRQPEGFSVSSDPAQWKILPSEAMALRRFQEDGTLQDDMKPEYLDLRALLDDPGSQKALCAYATLINVLDVFMCWVDIQEFKIIPTESYRCSKAQHIYHKYVKGGAILHVQLLTPPQLAHIRMQMRAAAQDPMLLPVDAFDRLQYKCFKVRTYVHTTW
jgi:hypothetical protein